MRVIAWAALHLRKDPAAPCPPLPNQVLFDSRTLRLQAKEGWVKLTLLERREKFYLDKSSFPASYLEGFGSATVTLLKRSEGYYLKVPVRMPQPELPASAPGALQR